RRKREKRDRGKRREIMDIEVASEVPALPMIDSMAQNKEKISAPICELCNEPITTTSTACPFCGEEFHKNHWQAWIQKRGKCPVCKENIKMIHP
ncbi:MAG: hypothetical protein ACFFB3_24005, partial [Candidatus Hodarchaeota archaeon]